MGNVTVINNNTSNRIKSKPLVSVYTCAFNMADRISRNLDSVRKQTYGNIEHIIVDDGSTDLLLPIIEDYMRSVDYPVTFIRQDNKGKHAATNKAWDYVKGMFQVQLDADDALKEDAVEFLVNEWFNIPEGIREQYWCVHGRSENQHGQFDGEPYPANINQLNSDMARTIQERTAGNKLGLQRVDCIAHLRYPEPIGVKHVAESVIFVQLNKRYRTWYTNRIVHTYWRNQDGNNLTDKPTTPQQFSNKAFTAKWRLINRKEYPCHFVKELLKYGVGYQLSTDFYKKNNPYFQGFSLRDKCLLLVVYPFTKMACVFLKK